MNDDRQNPPVFVAPPLSPEEREKLKEAWAREFSGSAQKVSLFQESAWRSISTGPRDKTRLDLWVSEEITGLPGQRIVDCWFDGERNVYTDGEGRFFRTEESPNNCEVEAFAVFWMKSPEPPL